jgi:hypothetical protein
LLYNDPEHWRQRAAEMRDIATKMTDPNGKKSMRPSTRRSPSGRWSEWLRMALLPARTILF